MLEEEIISYSFFKFSVWAISILLECVPVLCVSVCTRTCVCDLYYIPTMLSHFSVLNDACGCGQCGSDCGFTTLRSHVLFPCKWVLPHVR